MKRPSFTSLLIATAAGLAAVAEAQNVDTSDWLCEFCPFEDGSRGDYRLGASSVSDDSAYLGNASGYDEEGVYANVDGEGSATGENHRLRWVLEDLGLDSRFAAVEGSRPGSFDYRLAYRELPYRRFDTTVSVFSQAAGDTLSLPASWNPQPTTGAMADQIGSALQRRNIESDRSIFDVGGRYLAGGFSLSADYRRQQNDGVRSFGGSSFTNAALLPMPFDHVTDEIDIGLRYAAGNGFVSLGWYLSDFQNDNAALNWDHPLGASAQAEPSRYALAQAPDNQYSRLSVAAGYAFPDIATTVSLSAAFGQIEQDTEFLGYTVNPDVAAEPLPRSSLDGEIDTSRYAFALTSRPLDKTRLRLSYRYDERDNKTARDLWNRVIVDSLLSGSPEQNIPYSFERAQLKLSGDYDLLDTLRLSAGYERRDIDRDFQEVAEQTEDTAWGRLRWRPARSVEIEVRGGGSKRDIDAYNETFAAEFGQNPLMRKYHLAYRERRFGEFTASWSPSATPVSMTFAAAYADDDYAQSALGLVEAEEAAYTLDLGWSVSEKSSAYFNVGIENIDSEQLGSASFAAPDWVAKNEDGFTTIGAGFRMRQIADRIDLRVDYTHSEGKSKILVDSLADGASRFPDLETTLDDLNLRLVYRRSERLELDLSLRYQRFESEDWALQDVAPATIPVVLTLGAEPYDDETIIVGLGFRYAMGDNAEE